MEEEEEKKRLEEQMKRLQEERKRQVLLEILRIKLKRKEQLKIVKRQCEAQRVAEIDEEKKRE